MSERIAEQGTIETAAAAAGPEPIRFLPTGSSPITLIPGAADAGACCGGDCCL